MAFFITIAFGISGIAGATMTHLQSYDGHWLWANNGGNTGDPLKAISGGGTTWETFNVYTSNGKTYIETYDMAHYVWANNGGGGFVGFAGPGNTWQTFTMLDQGNGVYAFKTYDGSHYLTAVNGGGGNVDASGTSIGNYQKFTWSGYVPQNNYVVVGHSGGGLDYTCDGTNDQVEINQALATKKTVRLKNDGDYNVGSSPISITASDVTYTLTAYDSSSPPTIKATTDRTQLITSSSGLFNITKINFNGNGKITQCIVFSQSVSGSKINQCTFTGYTSASDYWGTGIYGNNQNTVDVSYNTIYGTNSIGVPIWIEGKTTSAGNNVPNQNTVIYAFVHDNQILNCKCNVGYQAAIQGEYLKVYNNNIVSYGYKGSTWATGSGDGIIASRSWILFNVIRGAGSSGIVPTCYPIWDYDAGHTDPAHFYSECANDAYCNVDHNICEYCGANGIDYWYSDYSVITNNRCNDNGQSADSQAAMDRDGIDICDHSKGTTVSNNECQNKASTKSDTLTGKGSYYVTVNHPGYWYDSRNGWNVPFDGMHVTIAGVANRISYMDMSNNRLYMVDDIPSGAGVGSAIVGVNEQNIGINTADNGQTNDQDGSYIGHSGTNNYAVGNLWFQDVPPQGTPALPNTNIYNNAGSPPTGLT